MKTYLTKLIIFDIMDTAIKPNHIGRKISRIRELRGIKQESMATDLGISQQAVSRMEISEQIDEELLEKVAKILGVQAEGIKNFTEEAVFNYFNTFNKEVTNAFNGYHNCTFNPLDKLVEAFEENKKLYERLVQAERDKVEYLEKQLKDQSTTL